MQHTGRSTNLLLPWLTLAAIIGTFAVNVWSNLSPLYGQTIGEISNIQFADVLIIPANYAFAIWGLIYLGLLGFGIFQLLPAQRQNSRLQHVRPLLILACVAQAVWVFFFLSEQFWLSVVAMLGILLPLIALYLRLEVGLHPVSRDERWLVQIPFGIYLGWISVATIVNIASALHDQSWNGWGISAERWTLLMIVVAAILGAVLTTQRREFAFPLVIVWALVAIAVRQSNFPLIVITATAMAIALAALVLIRMATKSKASGSPLDIEK